MPAIRSCCRAALSLYADIDVLELSSTDGTAHDEACTCFRALLALLGTQAKMLRMTACSCHPLSERDSDFKTKKKVGRQVRSLPVVQV